VKRALLLICVASLACASEDASVDAGLPDSGTTSTTCPDSASYIGASWPAQMMIGADELFLADAAEAASLEIVLSDKAKVTIAPGNYPIPTTPGTYSLRLPICLEFPGGARPMLGDVGQVIVTGGGAITYFQLKQQLEGWTVQLYADDESGAMQFRGGGLKRENSTTLRDLISTRFRYYDGRRHTITFQGGTLISEFRLQWGGTPSSGLLMRASGELDGTQFDQPDYYKLVNNFEHHFFGADWALLFEAPINGACGLRVDHGDPLLSWGDPTMVTLSRINCDLTAIDQRAISNQTTEPHP
jgi:hypothetical protein